MTLTITMIDGRRAMVLLGITLEGRPRRWKRALEVVLEVVEATRAGGDGSYALSAPLLGIDAPAARSIVEAVWKLQEEIVASLPRDVLEKMLEPTASA